MPNRESERSYGVSLSKRRQRDNALTTFGRRRRVLRRESRPAVGRALDAELAHPVAKGVGMEIQDFSRSLRPVDHPICLLKGCLDVASLHFFQRGQAGR